MKLVETKKEVFHYQKAKVDNPKGNIVFIHEYSLNCDFFNDAIVLFKDIHKYNYYGIELPGSKYNKISKDQNIKEIDVRYLVDYCNDFIEDRNLEKVILIGHSFGALIATRVANRFQKRVKKLFLISPMNSFMLFHFLFKKPAFIPKNFDQNLKLHNLFYFNIIDTLNKNNIEKIIREDTKYRLENRAFLKCLGNDICSFYNFVIAARKEESLIKQKTLIVSGFENKIIPRNSIVFAYKKSSKPYIQIDFFKEIGHIPFKETPEYFIDVLEEFIET
ncbi:MAG: alpha/beta fold hydrolase [Metamycoplasmataceae bacterium]